MESLEMRHADTSRLRAFRRAYREHYGFVWHALHRFGVPSHSLEDATQDTFLVAYRRRISVERSTAPLKGWLYGIARRVASNYRRSAARSDRKATALGHVHTGPRPDTATAYEAAHVLDGYLASLPENDRELFVLSELEGMTGPEIARALGANLNTTYSRIRKLRSRFDTAHAGDRPDLQRVANARPQATASGWAAFVPLAEKPTVGLVPWLSAAFSKKAVGVAIGACAAGGAVVAVDAALPTEPSAPPSLATASTATASTAAPTNRATTAAVPRPVAPGVTAEAEASPTVSPTPAPAPARGPTPASAPDIVPNDSIAAQNARLQEAAHALRRGDASAAMRITDEQRREHPRSPLADLRTAVHVEALCALGRRDEASKETEAFLAAHATSPVAPRIRRACSEPAQKSKTPDTEGA